MADRTAPPADVLPTSEAAEAEQLFDALGLNKPGAADVPTPAAEADSGDDGDGPEEEAGAGAGAGAGADDEDDAEGDGEAGGAAGKAGGRRRKRKKNRKKKKGKKEAVFVASDEPLPETTAELVGRLAEESAKARDAVDPAKPSERVAELTQELKRAAEDRPVRKFWDTQPVPGLVDKVVESGPLEEDKPLSELRQTPYSLPDGYEWCSVDVTNTAQRMEVYELLAENYVEDDDSMFRFAYPADFLKWALTPPGFFPKWHVGVRVATTGDLSAFISGVPCHIHVYDKRKLMCEINFLCVHKSLRSQRLAPVLIKEVTRRVNLEGIFQAVYTAGVVLPKPVSACRYYHRSLQPKKLIEIGFTQLAPRMTMPRTLRLYGLPEEPKLPGFRVMTPADVPQSCALLKAYLGRFQLWPEFDQAEFAHWMLPRAGVIDSYVVADEDGTITDLCSFYHLPSTVIGNDKHKTLHAVYSFYNVPGKHSLKDLLFDALIVAKKMGADVFNALDLQENGTVFKDLKFGPGDGNLHYYLYNWSAPQMDNSGVGLVLQ